MIPYLSLLILFPLLGFIVVLAIKNDKVAKYTALIFSLIPLAISIFLLTQFNLNNTSYQFYENYVWIKTLRINYILGVDGVSLPLVFLTTLLTTLSLIYSFDIEHRVNEYFALILLIEVGILGVFVALDLFLFYVFWEVVLIPMYFFIAIWGGPNRAYASIKFFIYTHVASVIMLIGIMAMYFQTFNSANIYTFSMEEISRYSIKFSKEFQYIVFIALFFGFGVKFPIVPFHTWLPDAHVEAPTAGSVLLAGLLLKMGGYGLIRIAIPMLPEAMYNSYIITAMVIIAIISILYSALVCLAQQDIKRLVAYSSISHMGLVLLGFSTGTAIGITGGIFQMFAHGLITAVLFMMAGSIHHHCGTRIINELGGIASKLPLIATFITFGFLASLGLPGLVSFFSEVLVFLGTYYAFSWIIALPLIGIVITAGYYIWTLQRAVFGEFNNEVLKKAPQGELHDLYIYEIIPLAILCFLIALFGVAPSLVVNMIGNSSLQIASGLVVKP